MPDNLDDQIKIAQRDKLLVEIEKTRAEKLKIDFEKAEAEKESKAKWRKQLLAILLGASVLGFYINFVIVPASDYNNKRTSIDNSKLELENQRKERKLFEQEKVISNDSISLERQKVQIDKLSITLTTAFDSLKKMSVSGSRNSAIIQTVNRQLNDFNQQQKDLVPNITGTWYSTLYNRQESWKIENTSVNGILDLTFTHPGETVSSTARYEGKGTFTSTVHLMDKGKPLILQYIWKVVGLNPSVINSYFTAIKSEVDRTPVGTQQPDTLVR